MNKKGKMSLGIERRLMTNAAIVQIIKEGVK